MSLFFVMASATVCFLILSISLKHCILGALLHVIQVYQQYCCASGVDVYTWFNNNKGKENGRFLFLNNSYLKCFYSKAYYQSCFIFFVIKFHLNLITILHEVCGPTPFHCTISHILTIKMVYLKQVAIRSKFIDVIRGLQDTFETLLSGGTSATEC